MKSAGVVISTERRPVHWLVGPTLALCSVIALFAKWGPDWPAGEFRAVVARADALLLWSDNWYSGHALAGYSLLYPLATRVAGIEGTGVLACVACAWCAARLVSLPSRAAWGFYAAGTTIALAGSLLIGQVPFLLGTAFGLAAVLACRADRWAVTVAAALACSLASPLAGAFLLLVAAAWTAQRRVRDVLPLIAACAGIGVSAVLGGASGPMPCPWSTDSCLLGACALILALTTRSVPGGAFLHRFVWLYATAAVVSFAVPNPIGGNIVRLARLIALPLVCYLISQRGLRTPVGARLAMSAIACAAAAWTLLPVVTSSVAGATDPSQSASYYQGLLGFLNGTRATQGRVEIPFTHDHWEARWVAQAFPLARGWERQTDIADNAVLYKPLTAEIYRTWLYTNAVHFVALPDVPLDAGGQAEASLLVHAPAYLRPVWHDAHWRVWRVAGSPSLATGAASLTRLGTDSFTAHFSRGGSAFVRIRASSLWQVTSGTGCVAPSPDGWLRLTSPHAGDVTLTAELSSHLFDRGSTCRSQTP